MKKLICVLILLNCVLVSFVGLTPTRDAGAPPDAAPAPGDQIEDGATMPLSGSLPEGESLTLATRNVRQCPPQWVPDSGTALRSDGNAAQSVFADTHRLVIDEVSDLPDRISETLDESAHRSLSARAAESSPEFPRLPIVLLDGSIQGEGRSVAPATATSGDSTFQPTETDGLANLQDDFIEKVGGADQNPDEPEYAQRWELAVSESDRSYRALYGKQAYLQKDIAAALEAASEIHK